MKIVQINSVFNYGSTGRIVKSIHTKLLNNGYESYVLYGRGPKAKEENVYKIGNRLGFILNVISTRLFNRHGEGNYIATYKLISKLKKIDPDIVQLHNIHGYYINYKILFNYLKKSNIKVVWLLHDRWTISGSSAFYDSNELEWENPSSNQLRKISKFYPKYFYFSDKSAITNYKKKKKLFTLKKLVLVSPSEWQAKILRKSFFSKTKIKVINNGINLEAFKPLKGIENIEKKIILGVANKWDNNKGLATFNELANDLGENYEIILVGTDNSVIQQINPRIKCVNRTKTISELVELYSKADVLVNPTLDDNFPTVNIEAQACGTPVITYDTGGSGESITTSTGLVIEKGNYNMLLESIKAWPKKNPQIITFCYENSDKYSEDNMVNSYINLYKSILE